MAITVETLAVRKRFGDEWTDVRDFVRPRDFMVRQVVSARADWTPQQMWQWVVETIRYPIGTPRTLDLYVMTSRPFPIPILGWLVPSHRYITRDFWEFPAEVLRDREADCEGSAALLVSMLRCRWPDFPAYVSVGYFREFGHVWVSVQSGADWQIWDTTLGFVPSPPPLERTSPDYQVLFRFDDRQVIQVAEELVVPERTWEPGKDNALRSWYVVVGRS